jgi:ribosomal protein S6
MEKRSFARAADRKVKEGFYVNFIFAAEPDVADALAGQFDLDEDVYRVLVTHAQPVAAPAR